jgi:hypothetical protein
LERIFHERDILEDRRSLFSESLSKLSEFIRGDYALVDSDIFGSSAFVVLPANLPKSWTRAEATKYVRSRVYNDCPPRVLLNSQHELFVALDRFVTHRAGDTEQLQKFKFALDSFMDGAVEQDSKGMATERWRTLSEDFSQMTGADLTNLSYQALQG